MSGINQCWCEHWPPVKPNQNQKMTWAAAKTWPASSPQLPSTTRCTCNSLCFCTSHFCFTWPKPKSTILLSLGVNWQLEQPEFVSFANEKWRQKKLRALLLTAVTDIQTDIDNGEHLLQAGSSPPRSCSNCSFQLPWIVEGRCDNYFSAQI